MFDLILNNGSCLSLLSGMEYAQKKERGQTLLLVSEVFDYLAIK